MPFNYNVNPQPPVKQKNILKNDLFTQQFNHSWMNISTEVKPMLLLKYY